MRKQNIGGLKDHHHLEHEKLLMELHCTCSQSALLYTLQIREVEINDRNRAVGGQMIDVPINRYRKGKV